MWAATVGVSRDWCTLALAEPSMIHPFFSSSRISNLDSSALTLFSLDIRLPRLSLAYYYCSHFSSCLLGLLLLVLHSYTRSHYYCRLRINSPSGRISILSAVSAQAFLLEPLSS
ncbi:hypothetical protein BJX68DRAFT_169258 [Aspergillus pseudodeflectus]|uniref:Uncharacterized protein n=1 Tax=Aspergillus pseudodeflectus TaxID=176178 RepID=A0ABR4JP42_9EURO